MLAPGFDEQNASSGRLSRARRPKKPDRGGLLRLPLACDHPRERVNSEILRTHSCLSCTYQRTFSHTQSLNQSTINQLIINQSINQQSTINNQSFTFNQSWLRPVGTTLCIEGSEGAIFGFLPASFLFVNQLLRRSRP